MVCGMLWVIMIGSLIYFKIEDRKEKKRNKPTDGVA